jgi:phage FluMu protein Com
MGNKCFKIKRVNRDKSEKDSTTKTSNSYKKEKESNNKDLKYIERIQYFIE